MNFLPRALCVFLPVACVAQAQITDPDYDDYVPTVEDELVIYTPKNSVQIGMRMLSGATSAFSGQGVVSSNSDIGEKDGVRARGYHDGGVGPDQRTQNDPTGTPVPVPQDGLTNNWGFAEQSQAEVEEGFIAMHAYKATITDSSVREEDPGSAFGVELSSEREMGSLFGGRVKWGVVAGLGINQILAETSAGVQADIETIEDLYSLEGQKAPEAPYQAPDSLLGVDRSVLLRNEIARRRTMVVSNNTDVVNRWKLRGAYMTFRAGPTLYVPFGSKFSASISTGAVLVYAGSTYEVQQIFTPETGDDIGEENNDVIKSNDYALLPGFYVDANLNYSFTDHAGLYLGAVYQSSGDYEQKVTSSDNLSNYKARIDLASLQGFRAGMTFRF